MLQTAFGWRISKTVGTTWKLRSRSDNESAAFHLHFSGTENVNYHHLHQYVALTPEHSYTLQGRVRCENLTTDQRPYIEVVGVNSKKLRKKTLMFAVSQAWQLFTLNFTMPPDCEQIYVRLRRNSSHYIDNLIAGDIWLASLSITPNEQIDD